MDLMNLNSFLGKTLIPAAEDMSLSYVTAVVITGLTVVFLGLIILILFVWAFGKFFTAKKTAPAQPQIDDTPKRPVFSKPVAAKPSAQENQDEVIAVIAAAVAAMGASEGKTYKLKSVKAVKNKPSRSAWAMTGIQSDTTPF